MKSAGNDIVALKIIDKQRTIQPAFYSKFITPTELALYQKSIFPFAIFIWLLWSVKESAYKYLKRGEADMLFSPRKFIVQGVETSVDGNHFDWSVDQGVNSFFKGEILFDKQTIYFQSVINNDFIATVVNGDVSFENLRCGIKQIEHTDNQCQSLAVRAFILELLKSKFSHKNLVIGKSLIGYPILFVDDVQIDLPISFAHHDRYVSYSFLNLK